MTKITIELAEWENALLEFLQEGYEAGTGETIAKEEVVHGLFEYFIITKAMEEVPEEVRDLFDGTEGIVH